MKKYKFFSIILILILPALVSGPAIPDIFISILAIFGLFYFIKDFKYDYENKIIIIFLIFYLYLCLNSFFSVNKIESFSSSLFYLRFIFFSFLIFLILDKENGQILKVFFYSLILIILVIGLDSIKQLVTGVNMFGFKIIQPDRPSGLFRDELIIGSYIARMTPILLSIYFFIYFNKKMNHLYIPIVILFFTNTFVIISGERAAMVLVSIIDIFFFISIPLRKKLKFFILTIILFILTLILSISDTVRERMIIKTYNQIFSNEDIYIFSKQHQSHYESAIKMFKEKPIIGQGVNTYRVLCNDKKYYINELSCSTHPHNSYIQLIAETGILGLAFLIFFYLKALLELFRLSIKQHKNGLIYCNMYILLSVIINFFPFLPSNNFFNNWINIIYYLPLGFYLFFHKKLLNNL